MVRKLKSGVKKNATLHGRKPNATPDRRKKPISMPVVKKMHTGPGGVVATTGTWGLALVISLLVAGLTKWLFLADQPSTGQYFLAISVTMFVIMLVAVVISVWQERAVLAAPFVGLTATLGAAFFYTKEFSSFLNLAELIIGGVALASWLLARVGTALRRRLRAMD